MDRELDGIILPFMIFLMTSVTSAVLVVELKVRPLEKAGRHWEAWSYTLHFLACDFIWFMVCMRIAFLRCQ